MDTEPTEVSVTGLSELGEPCIRSARNSSPVQNPASPRRLIDKDESEIRQTSSRSNAVARALSVLGCFVKMQDQSTLGVTEVASILGLSLGTTHRLVQVLVKFGYLEQDSRTARYRLGQAALFLGNAAERELGFHRAREVIEALAMSTGESVNLGVRDGANAVIVLRAESRFPLRLEQSIGSRLPLHASSIGKAILAFTGSEPEVPTGRLARITNRTLTKRSALLSELQQTRQRGYSIDNEEGMVGVRCVGAPVCQGGTVVAAIAIQVPSVRMPIERFDELGLQAVDAANRIALLLPDKRLHTERTES